MKKFLVVLLIGCFMLVGCNKIEGLTISFDNKSAIDDEEILKMFDDANDAYDDVELKPIVLLGTQVVAGTNYMFLCKSGETNRAWKVAIVYKDLDGLSKITSVVDFDYNNYYGKDNGYEEQQLSGGWSSNHEAHSVVLTEKAQNAFNQAVNTYKDGAFLPITLIASGESHYVVLCKDSTIFSVVTIKDNKITNIYDLDLASFNK